jgi:hypothetical protein
MLPPHLTHSSHQLGQTSKAHLQKQLTASVLDRPNPNLLRIGDLATGLSVDHHFQDALFPFREGLREVGSIGSTA